MSVHKTYSTLSLLFCLLCAWPVTARAEGAKVLFVAKDTTPFSARVRAEIEAMGFELIGTDVLDVEGRSTTLAAAYVLETPPPRRVELWLENPTSGRLELSRVIEASQNTGLEDDDAPETVRASEQLRAFFQPLRARSAAAESPSLAAPTMPRALPELRTVEPRLAPVLVSPHFFEQLALSVPIEPGSLSVDAVVRGGFWALPRLGIGGRVAIPVSGSIVRSGDNAASVSATLLGAELALLWIDQPMFRLLAQGGLSLAWLRATGTAAAGYTNRTDSALALLPSFGLQLGLRFGEHAHACFGAELAMAIPRLEIAFAGQRVATWGRPFGLPSAGVSLDF